jgi:hypothetical protein
MFGRDAVLSLTLRATATLVCVITSLCKGIVPFRGGGGASAGQRAPLARMHSKLHQPPTTPCRYISGQSSGMHVPLCRCVSCALTLPHCYAIWRGHLSAGMHCLFAPLGHLAGGMSPPPPGGGGSWRLAGAAFGPNSPPAATSPCAGTSAARPRRTSRHSYRQQIAYLHLQSESTYIS